MSLFRGSVLGPFPCAAWRGAAAAQHEQRGLIPRLLAELFAALDRLDRHAVEVRVSLSAFELYQEDIVDLLPRAPRV